MKRMNTWLNAKSNSGTKSNREVDYLRKSVRHLDTHIIVDLLLCVSSFSSYIHGPS